MSNAYNYSEHPLTDDSIPEVEDTDFTELDSLIPSAKAKAPDDFSDLDSLLSSAMADAKEAAAVRASRKLLGSAGVDSKTKSQIQATIRSWEVRREWTPVANVVLFHWQDCQCCGNASATFAGYYQRQLHKVNKINRWVNASKPLESDPLPREVKYEEVLVPVCVHCAGGKGYVDPDADYEIATEETNDTEAEVVAAADLSEEEVDAELKALLAAGGAV